MFSARAVVFLVHGNEHGRGERPAPVCCDHGCWLPGAAGHLRARWSRASGDRRGDGRRVRRPVRGALRIRPVGCGADVPAGSVCSGCVAVREGRTGGRGPVGRLESQNRRTNQSRMLAQLVSWLWRSLRLLPPIPGRRAAASPYGMARRPGPDHGGAGRDVLPDAWSRRAPTHETATR